MALLHRASITPTKQEVLDGWVPRQPWCAGGGALRQVGSYRFDDPADEVGLETFLVTLDGGSAVLHVPLSYRPAPLVGADEHLITTMEHSALGRRWVYDACGDPVYAATLATTVLTGAAEAEQHVLVGDRSEPRELTTHVRGSGSAGAEVPASGPCVVTTGAALSRIVSGALDLVVVRRLGAAPAPHGAATLTGTWPGVAAPAVLAWTG